MTDVSLRHLLSRAPRLRRFAGKRWRRFKRLVEGAQRSEVERWINTFLRSATPSEWRMLTQLYDDTSPLPPNCSELLVDGAPHASNGYERPTHAHLCP